MENEIKIEKGIPVPERAWYRSKYPWGQLSVGDSFFVPIKEDRDSHTAARTLYQCASRHKANGRGTFLVKRVDGGVRVWRTA